MLSPADWDSVVTKERVLEPTVLATIICPNDFVGRVIQLCYDHRGTQEEHRSLGNLTAAGGAGGGGRVMLRSVCFPPLSSPSFALRRYVKLRKRKCIHGINESTPLSG